MSILEHFNKNTTSKKANQSESKSHQYDALDILQNENNTLKKQLENNDLHIKELTKLLDQQQQLTLFTQKQLEEKTLQLKEYEEEIEVINKKNEENENKEFKIDKKWWQFWK